MRTNPFGNTGLSVTSLGIGASEIGHRGASDEVVERLIAEAIDAGVNVIDTAECYVDSEEKLGRALR